MIGWHRNGKSHRNGSSPSHDRNGNGHRAGREIRIRSLEASDADELRVLAERDTARPPGGEVVVAERDGRLLAAISLTSGEVVADPFHRTADLVTLLRTRAGRPFPPVT